MTAPSKMTSKSVIFVTGGGPYADKWLDEFRPFPCNSIAGIRTLEWLGQDSGRRDHRVKPGTLVAMRDNDKVRGFTLVGVVGLITKVKDSPAPGKAATYNILVYMFKEQPFIPRADDDRHAHWATLRHIGIPHKKSGNPGGIW